nr:MAG TPA: hypothetical protein [Caudoviricetes sp.]
MNVSLYLCGSPQRYKYATAAVKPERIQHG